MRFFCPSSCYIPRTCSPRRATAARRSWSNSALSAVFSVFKLTQLVGRMSASGRVSVCNSPLSQQPFFAINRCSVCVCVGVCICVKRDVLLHSISIFVRQCFFFFFISPRVHWSMSPRVCFFYERARANTQTVMAAVMMMSVYTVSYGVAVWFDEPHHAGCMESTGTSCNASAV